MTTWQTLFLILLPLLLITSTALIFRRAVKKLGLAYGWIAFRMGSALWPAISHSLSGILALGGAIAPSLLFTLGRQVDLRA